jgi:RNA polymerase sigma-70 factor (ECF subfamily)
MTNELMTADSTLLVEAKNGEGRAFEFLMSRYQARIFALAFRITRNREDAQDVVQQSFHKAFLHLDTFEGKSAFSTWLTRVAINEALLFLRKKRRRSEISLEDLTSETKSFPNEIPHPGKNPAEIYEQDEARRNLSKAVERLSVESRAAVLLRLEERSIEEAAEILGVGSGALKSRYLRAREKLRVLLTPRPRISVETKLGGVGWDSSTGLG